MNRESQLAPESQPWGFADEYSQLSQQDRELHGAQTEASSIKAAERCFDLAIAREFTAARLSESFKHCWQMRRIDFLGTAVVAGKPQHGACDFVLALGRQAAHGLKCLLKQFRHTGSVPSFAEFI